MDRDRHSRPATDSVNRRNALWTIGAVGLGTTGIGGLIGTASADGPGSRDNLPPGGGGGDPYKQYGTRSEKTGNGTIEQRHGAGIDLVNQSSPGDANYREYDINISGDGYFSDNNGGLADFVMRKQGVVVKETNPEDSAVLSSSDKRVRGIYPVPNNLPSGTFGAVTTALSLASSAVGAGSLSYVLGAGQLASKMGKFVLDDSGNGNVHDWQKVDAGGFKTGGHHAAFSLREYSGSPISVKVYSRWGGVVHGWRLNFDNGFKSIEKLEADLGDIP